MNSETDDLITELLGRVSVDPRGYKGDKLLLNRCLLALQQQQNTVSISRECADEALGAMQVCQADPTWACGELAGAISEIKKALESSDE